MVRTLVIESYLDDGKLIEIETGQELTVDEAINIVCEDWNDMGADYYSFNLTVIDIPEDELIKEVSKEVE